MRLPKSLFSLIALLSLLAMLAACGSDETMDPEPTAGPPTASADEMSVGDVIAMADAPWATVQTMRTTSQSSVTSDGTSNAAFTGTVQDWDANGNRHIIEFVDGIAINEQIYADGVIYMRGQFVSAAIAPGLDVNVWITVDPDAFDPNSSVAAQLDYLTREQRNPYGVLSDDVLNRPVQDEGEITVGERVCHVYAFGDEAGTGNEIRYEIAVDSAGLPCQVVQRAGDSENVTVYLFDTGTEIAAPLDGTPVAATPEG